MEYWQARSVVAALLTVASLDGTGHSAQYTVKRYRDIIDELDVGGGPLPGNKKVKKSDEE